MCLVEIAPPPGGRAMLLDITRWDEAKKDYVVDRKPKLQPACQVQATDGMVVLSNTSKHVLDARAHEALVTVEEGCIAGGAGSAVSEALAAAGLQRPVLYLGLPDRFIEHGDPARLLALQGLDAAGIQASIEARFMRQATAAPVSLKVVS